MKILKVEWRNFSSYGNRLQVLEFPVDPGLFQIIGGNGEGKSSISQVITFALYGKVEGKKLGDIPNRINGNAWVRIQFENNSRVVTVERGIEPTLFNLYIDGVLYDQAGQKNLQDYLTDDLIGIPYYVFNNTISLSVNDFKSFIKMSPSDKRAIVDKIFGFQIINQMREILKDEAKRIKENSDSLKIKMDSTESSLSRSIVEMETLVKKIEENTQDEISNLEISLQKFISLQKIHSEKLNDFKTGELEFQKIHSDTNRLCIETRSRISEIQRKIDLYNKDKCPTCETLLGGEFYDQIRNELLEEKKKAEEEYQNLEKERKDLEQRGEEIKKTKIDLYDKGSKIENKIKDILKSVKTLKEQKTEEQVSSLNKLIQDLEKDKEEIIKDQSQVSEKSLWIKTLDDILGERGVKQMAIKTILPSLNTQISELLSSLNLDYQVFFDEEFKASIYHLGLEIPSQTLSTGEMKKVDFVVLIAIMKLMKLKFSSINLLFLDELFSSVDADGVHTILGVLKQSSKDLGLNIFVINHAPMPHEIFDWKINVSKTNNFSSITVDKF